MCGLLASVFYRTYVRRMAQYIVVAPETISVDYGPKYVIQTGGRIQKFVTGQTFEADPSIPDIVNLLKRYPPAIMVVPPGTIIPKRAFP